jgi:hypothetical protein
MRKYVTAALTAAVLLGTVGDAAARRHRDGWCVRDGKRQRCAFPSEGSADTLTIKGPRTCTDERVRLAAVVTDGSRVRSLTLSLDLHVKVKAPRRTPRRAALTIDCGKLVPGPTCSSRSSPAITGPR